MGKEKMQKGAFIVFGSVLGRLVKYGLLSKVNAGTWQGYLNPAVGLGEFVAASFVKQLKHPYDAVVYAMAGDHLADLVDKFMPVMPGTPAVARLRPTGLILRPPTAFVQAGVSSGAFI